MFLRNYSGPLTGASTTWDNTARNVGNPPDDSFPVGGSPSNEELTELVASQQARIVELEGLNRSLAARIANPGLLCATNEEGSVNQ